MALKANELNVGDVHEEEVVRNLTRTQIVQYAGKSGDYNPLHDHDVSYDQKCMAFSIILYCMVPPQIAKLGDNTKLHSNGGATDGCTYFCWGTNTGADPVSYTHLTLPTKRIV